jgi:alkanesulfonate monooxygenase SsuD/methylene tetrahydromethanopterin reductase-like flavin-dependent oxidoreductase (luciferase family)
MDIGFGAPVSGAWATPRNLTELGRRAERLGYRSLWTFQRLLAAASSAVAPV